MEAEWENIKPRNGWIMSGEKVIKFREFDNETFKFDHTAKKHELKILLASLNPDGVFLFKEEESFIDSVLDKNSDQYKILKKCSLLRKKFTGIVHYSNTVLGERLSSIIGSKLVLKHPTKTFKKKDSNSDSDFPDALTRIKNNKTNIFSKLEFISKLNYRDELMYFLIIITLIFLATMKEI